MQTSTTNPLAVIEDLISQLIHTPSHELAVAFGARGKILSDLGDHAEAADSCRRALSVVLRLSAGDPAAYEVLAQRLREEYLEACAEAGEQPDAQLLDAVAPLLG
ncbi:MAG: hypothetical protein ACM33T_12750 [Solirubrobacterales bacterium]